MSETKKAGCDDPNYERTCRIAGMVGCGCLTLLIVGGAVVGVLIGMCVFGTRDQIRKAMQADSGPGSGRRIDY